MTMSSKHIRYTTGSDIAKAAFWFLVLLILGRII
jgi:hypothetical protein